MNGDKSVQRVVVTTMNPREKREWDAPRKSARPAHGRAAQKKPRILPRHLPALAAAICCLGVGVYAAAREGSVSAVVNHLSGGFEYDDTLGRLQFVSNILPESAMVFLQGADAQTEIGQVASGELVHAWSEAEPWLEYACFGDVTACRDGEVMSVVRNRQNEYTVRVMHDDGCESIYSGLTSVNLSEADPVSAGQALGVAGGDAAFEWRRDGLSVQPVFQAL